MRKFAELLCFNQSNPINRLNFLRLLISSVLALQLYGCATNPKVVASPQVLLQGLRIDAGANATSNAEARILMHNFSNIPMTFTSMRGEFKLEGKPAALLSLDFSLELPGESPENLNTTLALSPAAMIALSASQPLQYTLQGTITTIKPSRSFKFFYEGQLNPTPGVIGAWR
jgi:hypothetical protein